MDMSRMWVFKINNIQLENCVACTQWLINLNGCMHVMLRHKVFDTYNPYVKHKVNHKYITTSRVIMYICSWLDVVSWTKPVYTCETDVCLLKMYIVKIFARIVNTHLALNLSEWYYANELWILVISFSELQID